MRFATQAIHAGQDPDPATGATIPPVHFTTTYTQAAPGVHKGFEYSRSQNPTRAALETCLAALEGGEACAAFGSGLAASAVLFQSLRPGDGIVAGHDLYGGTYRLLDKVFKPWGLETVFAENGSLDAYAAAINTLKQPRLLWIESPTNPLLDVVDIAALAQLAKSKGMLTAVDNTFATPALQQPIALGADFVVHSTTKYLGGHSDVIGGAVIAARAPDLADVRFIQNAAGAVPGPMDCYLLTRGIKTLQIRMERHCANASQLASWLESQPQVRAVHYPGLEAHPGHGIAARQMTGFGGMIAVSLQGDHESTRRFCSSLKVFALAESLGGVESLCGHPASMTHASVPRAIREARGITDTLVRLSVGIEDLEDLKEDLQQALATAFGHA